MKWECSEMTENKYWQKHSFWKIKFSAVVWRQDGSKVVPTKESRNKFDQNDLTFQKVSYLKSASERKIFSSSTFTLLRNWRLISVTKLAFVCHLSLLKVFTMIGWFNAFCLTLKSSIYLCDFNIEHLVPKYLFHVNLSLNWVFKLFLIKFNPDIPPQEKTELSSHFSAFVSGDPASWKEKSKPDFKSIQTLSSQNSGCISFNHNTYQWRST